MLSIELWFFESLRESHPEHCRGLRFPAVKPAEFLRMWGAYNNSSQVCQDESWRKFLPFFAGFIASFSWRTQKATVPDPRKSLSNLDQVP